MNPPLRRGIDRYTLTSDLTPGVRGLISKSLLPMGISIAVLTLYLAMNQLAGVVGFVLMSVGTYIVLSVWMEYGIGLPLLPVIAVQHFFTYALPIAVQNETILAYPDATLLHGGIEVLVFLLALSGGWRFGMQVFSPSRPMAYTLYILAEEGSSGLRRIGYSLAVVTSIFYLLQSLEWLTILIGFLPSGSEAVVNALISASCMCGFFIIALGIGSGEIPSYKTWLFWGLFIFNCLISAASLLLSATTGFVTTVVIGLFWGSNKIPWKFMTIVIVILGFLNLGKFEMRERYWDPLADYTDAPSFSQIPARYAEWADTSLTVLSAGENSEIKDQKKKKDNSILSRVNNLQNLLYVIDAVETEHVPLLLGSTYTIIPPLLIPRILWPDKPRTHEGQVMLNVHFGRQDLISSNRTYIAWGLLPEAYGNFGPFCGAIILGLVLGGFIAWVENASANKPILSMEGLLVFTLFLNLTASFEMVASVLITSIFQSLIPVIIACMPFVYRSYMRRPEPDAP